MPGRDLIERVRKALGDRYTVLAAVGRGGNASIFAGRDPTGAPVAIKVLHPELAVSVAADRFLREIRYASQLNHPHIARMMDSGEADYLLWYVMPYLPGETLRQALRRESRLSISTAVAIAAEVLDALEHAHAQGVPDVDGRTDLYSLGVVLFECLAGRPPFSSPSAAAVLDMHQHNPAPDLHGLRRDVPRELAAVVARALAKSRAERWQRALEMREALLPFAAGDA